jgi:hypothetical protein
MRISRTSLRIWFLLLLGMAAAAETARAQATFQVSSAASTVTAIGHTELAGEVTLTVVSGTTVAGQVEITYPVPLANSTATGIGILATGGLAAGTTVSAAPGSGVVIVNIPAGATAGSSVTIRGVRFSAAANNTSTMSASVSSTGNFVTAGQGVVLVVSGTVANGFTLQTSTSPSFTVANGQIITPPGEFTISETYERSFSDAVGQLGQTVPTQVIFQVTGLPDNVTLTFPTTAVSTGGATLTTSTGAPVVVSNLTTNQVVYLFGSSLTSQSELDSFRIMPTAGFSGTPGSGTAFIQVALGPLGAAVPDVSLPSTDIPRYSERFLPALSSIPGAVLTQIFPTFSLQTDQVLAVSNLGSGSAVLSFTATRTDATTMASTLNPLLAARQTRVFSIGQLFGAGASTISAIRVDSLNNRLAGTSFGVAPGGSSTTAPMKDTQRFVLPLNLTSANRDAMVLLTNTGAANATVNISLRTASGQTIATVSRDLAANATIREQLLTMFNVPATAVPTNAYIDGVTPTMVRVSAFANPNGPVEELAGLTPQGVKKYRHPYFAVKDGYTSLLSMVNISAFPITVTATPFQTTGAAFSGVSPVSRVVNPQERLDLDIAAFFSGTSLIVGSLNLDIERADSQNPFSTPLVAGVMRTGTASSSAIIPLFGDRFSEFFVTPVTESAALYTGIALVNDTGATLTVTIDVFSPAGSLLGTNTVAVNSQAVMARLVRDMVPASLGIQEGLVRVTAPSPIAALAFRGSLTSTDLVSLTPQP